MKLIDALREIEKTIVALIGPDWIRFDTTAAGTQISCMHEPTGLVLSAKCHHAIEGLSKSFVIPTPKMLSFILASSDYQGSDSIATFIDGTTTGKLSFEFSNAMGTSSTMTVWSGDQCMNERAKQVNDLSASGQLFMPVTATWKQQFEYWSKHQLSVVFGCKAAFFMKDSALSCMVGDYNFDHHIWHCDQSEDSTFISAIQFECQPMLRALSVYPYVKRMNLAVSGAGFLLVRADSGFAEYCFYILARVPYWFVSVRSPLYDLDDPRSVLNQRADESWEPGAEDGF